MLGTSRCKQRQLTAFPMTVNVAPTPSPRWIFRSRERRQRDILARIVRDSEERKRVVFGQTGYTGCSAVRGILVFAGEEGTGEKKKRICFRQPQTLKATFVYVRSTRKKWLRTIVTNGSRVVQSEVPTKFRQGNNFVGE